jgi:hypothetical protein
MIEAAISYSVIEEILTILSGPLSTEAKNQAILDICQSIADSLKDKADER